MKVLVAYMSKTGNTKKVAEAIFAEIKEDKELKPIEEVDSIQGYNLSFLGFPVQQMGPDKKAVKLLEKHCVNGRNVVLFITHAAPEGGKDLLPMLDKFRQVAGRANIIDMFDCQGQLAGPVKFMMSMMPDARLRLWAKTNTSQGQPDQSRLDRARGFSRNVMQKVHGKN